MPLSMNAFALSATVLGAVVTTAALHRPIPAKQPPAEPAPASIELTRASTLIGMRIVDAMGVRLARVQDVVVEPSGAVVVIAQRQDTALVGVPLELLKPRVERRAPAAGSLTEDGLLAPQIESLRLRAESERLVAATVFARAALDSLDQVTLDGVRRHWTGEAPEPRGTADPAAPLALCLGPARGDRVKNGSGETLGEIEDVVLDLSAARAAYVVLSCGGVLGVGATDHGVAPGALQRSTDGGFLLAADRKTLDNSPGIDLDRLPSRPSLQVPAKVSLADGSYAHRTPR